MTEYKSLTHIIVDMLEAKRQDIKNVPRNEKTNRKNLPIVARKGNVRDDGTQTKQDEILNKVIDETQIAQAKKPVDKVKSPKKLEIQDVGKQPPTQVVINPELEKTNIFNSKKEDGKLIEGDKPYANSKKEAQDVADFVKKHFQGKSFGGFKVTGELTPEHIRQGAKIRERLNKLKEEKLGEETIEKVHAALKNSGFKKKDDKWHFPGVMTQQHVDKLHGEMSKAGMERSPGHGTISWYHRKNRILAKVGGKTGEHYHAHVHTWNEETLTEGNRATIQYQSDSGVWITAQTTTNTPSNILTAMTQVQRAHDTNRVRAIDNRGSLVDMLAQQPIQSQPFQLPFGRQTPTLPTFKEIDFPERKERVTFGRALGMWLTGEETKPKEKFVENPKGKINKQNTGWKSRMAWIKDDKASSDWWKSGHKAYHDAKNKKPLPEENLDELSKETIKGFWKDKNLTVKKFNKKVKKDREEELDKKEQKVDEGLTAAGVGKSVGSTGATAGISAALSGIKKAYPKAAEMIDKVQAGYANVSKYMPPGYATFAGQRDVLPAKIVTDYIEKNRAKKETKAEETIYKALDRVLEARHSGIETDEPKFGQSIQKVAAHAKTYADVEHTYRHADGSKTRVNQDLGEKIHRTIHSTPHRHRADLIQKMHKSAAHLKHALGEKNE